MYPQIYGVQRYIIFLGLLQMNVTVDMVNSNL